MQRILAGITLAALLLPLAASALTADELRVQINDLLAKIQALQAQIAAQQSGTTGTVTTSSSGSTTVSGGLCPRVSRVLQLGDSGADVTRLQQFLALNPSIYPEALVTGYYGSLTETAVKRFQCANKIVCDGDAASTGYGVTGPRTAAILALQCPDGGSASGGSSDAPVSGFIKVTPTSGSTPLSVTVDATVNTAHSCLAQTYQIDYGDGSAPASMSVPANGCVEIHQVFSHVYVSVGTFQVLLRSGTHQVSATVSVSQGTVLSAAADTFSGSPTSGSTPLTVNFSGVVNAGGVCNAGPYSITFGDGASTNISVAGCTATNYVIPHAYSTSGSFTAHLYRGNPAVNIGSVAVTAGGSVSASGGSFSVTPTASGSASAVFSLSSSCARYDLDWGDGSAHASQAEGSCSSGATSKTLSHAYSTSGSYTITLKRGSTLNFTDTAGVTIVQ